jgi:uncharacterized protein (TIGR03435 family)
MGTLAPVLALWMIGMPAVAQQPAFEVASVKPSVSGDPGPHYRSFSPTVRVEGTTLKDLLTVTYDVQEFRISGGPSWINSDRYDIEAKAGGNPASGQWRLMLQTLLEDRFKLVLHRETKELPIYELTLAKGGLKLQPLSCISCDPAHPPAPDQKSSEYCGNVSMGRGIVEATSAGMLDLARIFSTLLDRAVVDKTGISGKFPVHLKFAPDDVAAGAQSTDAGPSIFTAVQEQLGLKLESARGPVEVLAIDHVEKPSEN